MFPAVGHHSVEVVRTMDGSLAPVSGLQDLLALECDPGLLEAIAEHLPRHMVTAKAHTSELVVNLRKLMHSGAHQAMGSLRLTLKLVW